ncbi:MAG: hypothetical protein LBD13_03545 [Spirochaetaceae bacterium]|jgi:hypothetical protein|nr:hypothetical protein [Spirochaetaceae bacterium]
MYNHPRRLPRERLRIVRTARTAAIAAPRPEVLNTRVRAAFERLIASMQDVKDRYFTSPPLLIKENLEGHRPSKPPIKASCVAPVRKQSAMRRCFWVVTKRANPIAAGST